MIQRECKYCHNKELEVVAAVKRVEYDIKNLKIINNAQTITKCPKCKRNNYFVRNKKEREETKDFINEDVCIYSIKKMSKTILDKLVPPVEVKEEVKPVK